MKYSKPLSDVEICTLEELVKNHSEYRYRTRAQSILLSSRGYKINEIANIYQVDRDTVSIWIDCWEKYGLVGIFDEFKSGRPTKLTKVEQQKAIEYVQEEPRSLKHTVAKLEGKHGKTVSTKTIKRLLKKGKHVWKRMRTSLFGKKDQGKFEIAQKELELLKQQQINGKINLYYYDEAGFTLTPKIPYAWQKTNENILLPSARSKSFNILGLLQPNGNFESMVVEGTVNSEMIISYFDQFAQSITQKTWIVLDNAPTHKSKSFQERIAYWESKKLYLYFLPAYSPELNLIEILWRFIKYQWLPFSAYLNIKNLENALIDILANIGKKYQITFI
jgi:transposase